MYFIRYILHTAVYSYNRHGTFTIKNKMLITDVEKYNIIKITVHIYITIKC